MCMCLLTVYKLLKLARFLYTYSSTDEKKQGGGVRGKHIDCGQENQWKVEGGELVNDVEVTRPSVAHGNQNTVLWKFLLTSGLGLFFFLCPVYWHGNWNIPIGVMSESLAKLLKPSLPTVATIAMWITAICTTLGTTFKVKQITENAFLKDLFQVSSFWFIIRWLGAIFATMTLLQVGPEAIISDDTGGLMLFSLLGMLIVWFFVASYLMPLLTEFGIMDFVGVLIRGFIKPLFTLPGRSALDLLTSWVGNCNVGVQITRWQYVTGYYTAREAAVIATCFSAVSLPFCLVIANTAGIANVFPQFYLATAVAGVVAAIVVPRMPPLSRIPDDYYGPVGKRINEQIPIGISRTRWGLEQALKRAEQKSIYQAIVIEGSKVFIGIVFGLVAQSMALGTLGTMVVTYTPVVGYLSTPMVWLLQLFQVPEAAAAAPGTIIGFADQFIPAVVASTLVSPIAKFVIAGLSVVQIIYMTEVGSFILMCEIPVNFSHLVLVFLERTLVCIPVLALAAHLVF